MFGCDTKSVGHHPVATVFATPTLAALLCVFARAPERRYYQKELVDLVGGSLYLVQRELKRLESAGLVSRIPRGRQVEYEVNREHPSFSGLRAALLGTVALGSKLEESLRIVGGIRLAFIFGSVARGEDSAESDLDLLVVGRVGLKAIAKEVIPVVRDLDREPNIAVLTEEELCRRAREGEHFVSEILAGPKIWLIGSEKELAQIVEQRTTARAADQRE